ncbi:uncharacterized protein LOC131428910 [Malaya genurostris]|uniref:uncharacterized protein LOC131428910 n=1 Tax=Malaya genurostris TaxID=325434 RepID=UPI0026F3E612|nr:uncharacterized protein LOC131428910 [Malaya genurostris]
MALEKFNQAYVFMRVDHLHFDELDFELITRNIFVSSDSDHSGAQRQRRLRGILSQERSAQTETVRTFRGNAAEEKEICLGKLLSIKEDLQYRCPNKEVFRTRLLHLGSRLQVIRKYAAGDAYQDISGLLEEVVAVYGCHFSDDQVAIPPETKQGEDGEVIGDLLGKDVLTSQPDTDPSDIQGSTNAQLVGDDLVRVLCEMRDEIRCLRQQSEENRALASQRSDAFSEATKTLMGGIASLTTISSVLRKTVQEVVTLRESVNELRALIHQETSSNSGMDLQTDLDNTRLVDEPEQSEITDPTLAPSQKLNVLPPVIPDQQNFVRPPLLNGQPNLNYNPNFQFQTQNQQYGPSLTNQPFPISGFVGNNARGNYSRRPQRVSDWKIKKYAGTDDGTGLNEFLDTVANYAACEQMCEEELFNSAMHLFTGNALSWYQAMRAQNRLFNWNHLVCELKANFVHPELDATLKMKALQRRQLRNESFQEYFLEMEKIFRAMTVSMTPSAKLDVLKRNLRSEYKQMLILRPVNTLAELMSLGKSIDASKTPIYQKVFGSSKEVAAYSDDPPQNKQDQTKQKGGGQNNSGAKSKTFWNKNSQSAVLEPKQPPDNQKNQKGSQDGKNLAKNTQNPKPNNTQEKPVISLQYLVEKHRPPVLGVCYNCGDKGHEHEDCQNPKRVFCINQLKSQLADSKRSVEQLSIDPQIYNSFRPACDKDYENSLSVETIVLDDPSDDRPFAIVAVYGKTFKALLDSGSNATIMTEKLYRKFSKHPVKSLERPIELRSANGQPLPIIGQAYLPYTFQNLTKVICTLIVEHLTVNSILGIDFWRAFGILPEIQTCALSNSGQEAEVIDNDEPRESILTTEQLACIEDVKKCFQVVEPGKLNMTSSTEHRIVIKEEFQGAAPVCRYPYHMTPKKLSKVWEEVDRWRSMGIIEESDSDWSLNIVAVTKPDDSIRLCLDARPLNERTVRDAYPLPHPGRILGSLPKAKYLSTIDLKEAFLQVPLAKDSRKYTAFSVPGRGMFQFTRLPFGLVNSPATLARLMDQVLGRGKWEPYVFVYLDDIIVVSDAFEHHLQLLKAVADCLAKANLTINLDGLKVNPDKIQPILDYERPVTVTKLRRFLGMCGYYRRFIDRFSEVTAPLTDLLKTKSKNIVWNSEAEIAFLEIKEFLVTPPVLVPPDFSKEFILQTDASDVAVAAVLVQKYPEGEKVVAYFSHKLTTPQRNYHATEKEGLAVILAVEHFRGYLEGYHFRLVTDSSAIIWILKTKWKTSSRLSRWSLELQLYDMSIEHRKGKDNVVPDALSRAVAAISALSTSGWYCSMKSKVIQSPDDYADFKVENDQLFKYVVSKSVPCDSRFSWKLIPAPECRQEIIKSTHEELLHVGYEKLIHEVQLRYYWPRMGSEVRTFLQNCGTCKEIKAPFVPVQPEMGQSRATNAPWRMVSVDYIGPLPKSKRGNQHLLVVLDVFSKYVMLNPVRKISSNTLCSILREQWFNRHGYPEILLSDNASTFTSIEFSQFLKETNVKHWLNSRYHSQANPVERTNRSINTAIRAYARTEQRNWDVRITDVERILNTTVHSSTGFSPHFIIHGSEMASANDFSRISGEGDIETRHQQIDKIREIVVRNL